MTSSLGMRKEICAIERNTYAAIRSWLSHILCESTDAYVNIRLTSLALKEVSLLIQYLNAHESVALKSAELNAKIQIRQRTCARVASVRPNLCHYFGFSLNNS